MIPFFSVSVLGCGWLGLPLAKALCVEGYRVKGSTTDLQKIPVLQKAGIFSFSLTVAERIQGSDVSGFLIVTLL